MAGEAGIAPGSFRIFSVWEFAHPDDWLYRWQAQANGKREVVKNRLTKSELLSAWEEKFGPLTDSQRKEFRSRRELAELVRLPRNIVLVALSFGPRLVNILSEALRLEGGVSAGTRSFDSYPESWVRLVTKYEKSTQMALGALAFRALMEERRGRVKSSDLKKSLKETENREGNNALEKGIEIVGESFYSSNFNHIRRQLSIDGGSEKVLGGELRNEPGNPHSLSGKAVQVFDEGKKVGYLPEKLAPGVFGLLEPDAGRMRVLLRVWFDHEENNPQRNSVRVLGKAETPAGS